MTPVLLLLQEKGGMAEELARWRIFLPLIVDGISFPTDTVRSLEREEEYKD
jgi:hypothetical protein